MPVATVVRPQSDTAWPLYQADHGLAFWPIFKNAHSSLVDWMRSPSLGFVPHIVGVPTSTVSFAVVRDPVGRYISGLAQLWRTGTVADVSWQTFLDGVEAYNWRTGVPYNNNGDRHFISQSATIDQMGGDPRLFPLNADGLDDLRAWLAARELTTDEPIDAQKVTDPDLLEYAHATLTRQIIRHYYDDDVTMWERCNR